MGGVTVSRGSDELEVAQAKERVLDGILESLGSVLVAFSGGVDSSYLAVRAHGVLGERALSVTADSESLAEAQRASAVALARQFGLRHRFVHTSELADPLYVRNALDRCYHCKTELFRRLVPLAAEEKLAHVVYGLIVDDLSDFRPGQRAASEAGVRSPLAEAGMGKADVRLLSRALGLPTWAAPASPCLSSRVPHGTPVSPVILRQVEAAEEGVRGLGFLEFRVRHMGEQARVEIAPDELGRLREAGIREALERAVRDAGYRRVFIDPEGYRRGRLHEAVRTVPAP